MRNRGESAAEAGRENLYIINGLQKTSPLKGQPQAAEVRAIHAPRAPTRGACAQRQAPLQALPPPWHRSGAPTRQPMSPGRARCEPGLCVGDAAATWPQDTLDLARWLRPPTGHERRLHGQRHAGVRLVQEGPTLLLALDAHREPPEPCRAED